MKKKPLIFIIIAIILAIVIGVVVKNKNNSKETTQEPKLKKTKITEPVNIIDIKERPYIVISPTSDGKHLDINVKEVKKEASNADYELEYQAGSLLQGVFGSIVLNKLPAKTNQLLGSCSAGGACTYHTDITGGYLTTRFTGKESYALKTEWKYIENKEEETAFSSRDAKFQIESDELSKARIILISNSSGYPDKLKRDITSEPYSLQTIPSITGTATLSIRANQEGNLTIMGYDGIKWHTFETTTEGKTAKATVELMEEYLVVTN